LDHIATDERGELPIRYSFHSIGTDNSILMLGNDLRSIADMQQQLVAAQIALETTMKCSENTTSVFGF
jgi:hypothetical protein